MITPDLGRCPKCLQPRGIRAGRIRVWHLSWCPRNPEARQEAAG